MVRTLLSDVLAEHSVVVPGVLPYRPGEFYLRELPPLRAVLRGVRGLGLLVVDGRRLVAVFGPVGRMALTNYLMHSIVCVTLSYGFGFGLWWHTGASRAMGTAAAIIVVQILLSALWLSRYRFGPIEWVWRRLTYRRTI